MRPRLPSLRQVRLPLLAVACLAVLFLLMLPSPVFAGWLTTYISSLATRSRAIQVSLVAMCVALFILMKKFAEPGPGPRR